MCWYDCINSVCFVSATSNPFDVDVMFPVETLDRREPCDSGDLNQSTLLKSEVQMDESGLLYSVKLVFGELKLSNDLTRDKGEVLEADSHPDDENPLDESILPSKLYQDTTLE